jgi:hypothetical protein
LVQAIPPAFSKTRMHIVNASASFSLPRRLIKPGWELPAPH